MSYAIYYSQTTGEISTVISFGEGSIDVPIPPEGFIGAFVPVPPEFPAYYENGTCINIGYSPSSSHVFNWSTKQWEDPRTLQDIKDAKWEAMKAARDAAEKSTFVWNGHIVDADMARLNGAATSVMIAQAQGYGYSDTWTLADNSTLPVTGSDILEMGLALAAHVSACHARGRALRQQILACTTKEQVDAIEWSLP